MVQETNLVATDSRKSVAMRFLLPKFIAKRIVIGLLLMLGITLISFTVTQLIPGDPAAVNLGQSAMSDPAVVAAWRKTYGLDKPVPVQYFRYIGKVLHGDLGMSQQSRRPVSTDLAEYFPATIEVAFFAILISMVVGFALGIFSAVTRDRLPDQIVRIFSLVGVSMPTFWTALIVFYLLFFKLGWLPSTGRLDAGVDPPPHTTGLYTIDALIHGEYGLAWSAFTHLLMPTLVLAIYTIGVLTRFTRASVLEILGNDYVRAARAKGIPESLVIRRHVLRPALLSIVTVAGVAFGGLLSGSVLVERVFSWPGLGQYAFKSAIGLDLPGVMGVSMVIAAVFITMNLIVDLLYLVIDPRLRAQ
jgi:ABC-type dipeptide/oligopeptide/nickel transport system permease component